MDVPRDTNTSSIESSYRSSMSSTHSNEHSSLEGSTISDKVANFMDSVRLFFGTTNLKVKSSIDVKNSFESETRRMSSGYHSFDASWEIDESYIKISKFSGKFFCIHILCIFLFSCF